MSQADYSIANQSAPDVRSEMNVIFAAIVSQNSGSTEPTTKFAYMPWYDTSTNILKMRNAANDAWIEISTFDQTNDKWSIGSDVQDADLRFLTCTAFQGGNSIGIAGGWLSNLGISLSAGTITISGYDGTALSATNKAYVGMKDVASSGYSKTYTLTANYAHDDAAGTSDWIGNTFGFTAGIASNTDFPLYLYLGTHDNGTTVTPFWSRTPGMNIVPITSEIGTPSSAIADKQFSFWAWSSITAGDYDGNPCLMIGSVRARKVTTADDMTIQVFNANDGFGKFQDSTVFTLLTGTFGAASGSFFYDNGGTAPQFTDENCRYSVSRDGSVHLQSANITESGVSAGSVALYHASPYQPSGSFDIDFFTIGHSLWFDAGGGYSTVPVTSVGFGDSLGTRVRYPSLNNSQIGAGDYLGVNADYKIATA